MMNKLSNVATRLMIQTTIQETVQKVTHKLKIALAGLCYGISLSMPVMAEDIEIYANSSAVDPSIQPNVLFLLDTSNSMGATADGSPPYIATEDYTDTAIYPTTFTTCFDPNTIYRLTNGGNTRNKARNYCDTSTPSDQLVGRVLFENFFCNDALMILQNGGAPNQIEAADSPGFYTGRVGRYRAWSGASNVDRWGQINMTSNQVVECQADRTLHGFLAGDAAVYATQISGQSGDARWTDDPNLEYDWSQTTRTVYTGNYLNYLIVTDFVQSYRIEVIRDAMINFVRTAADINLGFMPYTKRLANNRSIGGVLEVPIDDITNSRQAIIDRLMVYGTRHDYNDGTLRSGHDNLVLGTPSSRQYYEALRYFKGDDPVYGGTNSQIPSLASSTTDDPDGTGPNTTPSNTVAFTVANFPSIADARDPDGSYKSPVANECQKNFVILLTDGLPWSDSIAPAQLTEMGVTDTSCTVDPNCVTGGCPNTCLPSFAEAGAILDSTDTLSEIQPISTYTIGFGLSNATAIRALDDSAAISNSITGKGESFLANNAMELKEQLVTIVEALGVGSTFSSPAVSVNAFNRTVNLDDLYFTLFVPDTGPHWAGNFKKYKLAVQEDVNGDPVLDAYGNRIPIIVDNSTPPIEAVDSGTGFFVPTAQSFWSTTVDGDDITAGGALAGIAARATTGPTARKIYTYTGSYNTVGDVMVPANQVIITADNKVDVANKANVTSTLLGISPTESTINGSGISVLLHDALLDWASGIDVLDIDEDSSVTDSRVQMGDPLHSQPGIIQYGESAPGVADLVAYVATNDGYLHAIDADTGDELWAFIPQELLPLLNANFENVEGQPKSYGLDGDVVAWIDDANNDGTITSGTDRVVLYIGQRRGGNHIYALDVTNRNDPRLLWIIEGGNAGTAYEELGQTWSTVNVEKVKSNGSSETVLIFGGGYDTRHDNDNVAVLPRVTPGGIPDPVRDDSVGRTVFMANAETGQRMWTAGQGATTPTPNMVYSIAARIKPLDTSGDGNIDRLYVADLGGQLFRFDFNETALDSASFSAAAVTGGRIADLAADNSLADARKFYYPPDVALVAERGKAAFVAIAISSGYRAHPNNLDIQDRIFMLKDRDVFTAPTTYGLLTEADLYDATLNLAALPTSTLFPPTAAQIAASDAALTSIDAAEGWYIDLDNQATPPVFVGEKGLAEPLIVENQIIVTTFIPSSGVTVTACEPREGNGRVYFLDLFDGTASRPSDLDTRQDRYSELKKGGIPGEGRLNIGDETPPTICVGTECEALGGDVGVRKTFWYEVEL